MSRLFVLLLVSGLTAVSFAAEVVAPRYTFSWPITGDAALQPPFTTVGMRAA